MASSTRRSPLDIPSKGAPASPRRSSPHHPSSPMVSPQSPSRLNCYSQDRDDIEWDGCSHSSALGSDRERAIRPLPKRQRLLDSQEDEIKVEGQQTAAQGVAKRDRREDDALEEAFPPVLALAPALEYRTSADGYEDGTASNHPPRLRPPLFDSNELADSSKSSLDPSLSSDSPPTSPSSQHSLQLEDEKVRGPDYFPVFGEAGDEIVRSLATASSFSPAGLFGGLGLAALHPSLAPPVERSGTAEDDDEEEERDRIFSGERGHISLTVSIQGNDGGNNKKKRKIPGVNRATTNGEEDDRAFDAEEVPEPTPVDKAKAEGASDYGPDFVVKKASSDTPMTAKAALAKLRYRPPHVSISRLALSHRRRSRRYHRTYVALQKPLSLPPPTPYTAPASYSTGPPPLPPGSGLKGSKALKAAKKAEKEREKEKIRMKSILGGATIKLPNLWDPFGAYAAAARALRLKGAKVKSGYLTPPASSEEGDAATREPNSSRRSPPPSIPPFLDAFAFSAAAPPAVGARWKALQDQIERFKLAKERAAKARQEEKERRREKEKEAVKEVADARKDGKKASPSTVASKRSTVAIRPGVEPLGDVSPNAPLQSPTTTHPSLLPPPRKPPLKKGRKKRVALANGQNPHHRDNYIPSRIPASTAPHTSAHSLNDASGAPSTLPLTSWPASSQAIEAAGGRANDASSYFAGPDEWLCQFCEYELFFGDLRGLMKKRKKVLKVRSKAKERASKAANGSTDVPAPAPAPTPVAPAAAAAAAAEI